MKNVFIVLGYGVPKDIFKDFNLNLYLRAVFNLSYDLAEDKKFKKPLFIFSGGKTDCFKPFKRSEAREMKKFFRQLASRSFVKKVTKDWDFAEENKSISTLENLIFSKQILKKKKISSAKLYIFAEKTRERKVNLFAKRVFGGRYKIFVKTIDFDVSLNRYDKKLICKKEKQDIKNSFWALKSQANMKKYHQIFADRLKYLRKIKPAERTRAIRDWWRDNLKKFD